VSSPRPTLPPAPETGLLPKSESAVIGQERATLREILRLVSERADAEARVSGGQRSGDAAADQEYQRARQVLAEKIVGLKEGARKADEDRRRAIVDAALAGDSEAKAEFARSSRRIATEFDAVRDYARNEYTRAKGDAESSFQARERAVSSEYAAALKPVDDAAAITQSMRRRLAVLFDDYKSFGLKEGPATPTRESFRTDDPLGLLLDRLTRVEPNLKLLEGLIIPKAMKGTRWVWVFVVPFLLLVIPLMSILDATTGAAVAAVAGVGLGAVLRVWLLGLSKSQVSRYYDPISQSLVDADALAAHCRAQAAERHKAQRQRSAAAREDDLQKAKQNHARAVSSGESVRDERLREINENYARTMVEVQTRQHTEMRAALEAYDQRKAEVAARAEAAEVKVDQKYQALKDRIGKQHVTSWAELERRWREGMNQAQAALEAIVHEADGYGPRWDDPGCNDRPLPKRVPPSVRFGEFRLDLKSLPRGIPTDSRLMDGLPAAFTFPALMPFPGRSNLLVEAPAEGRSAAIGLLQAAMLRLLTSLPPGQVRFTIVDPIGIGRNFGAFMHLADFDEALVTNQVWTEPRQIEERLADLSAHMEKVTQKYLRNEYATIEEYNAVAGEVAEPYRVLVIADFPSRFDEEAAARLAAIAAGGPPCGVLTLVALDRDRPLPPGFNMGDLREHSTRLSWEDGRLAWDDPEFGRYPLAVDLLPPAEVTTRLIHRAGAAAKDAKRVEVPFDFIAPPREAWWTGDSRSGIDIALGKAGATKRQHLELGQGTSQHVLIAGRTGSGKSTLLHALITNLALTYSPDEVDLYLIDFKKGVEFKVYALHELPHASVVAIESEREFGISVLQRLDAEMRERADRFRDAGVQDLNGYRNAPGTPPLPRVLLIIDEFQEFFVEEDKVAQEAALLLDRLVRQGRAFGVHVHLGSQTLGGAYALARSTLGQMAVRIALQCSEADAHLILSEQNTAARLLSRPGEAVYNDANGLEEGNHFFQVVWLPDDRRESYLKQVAELARTRKPVLARTPIVFEGDAPAVLGRNPLLRAILNAPSWPSSPRSAQAWLGDPVAIKDPTSALFRRQGGNHLLVVGQNPDAALGILASALVGLAAQYPPPLSDTVRSGASFAVLDGTPEDDPRAGAFARVAAALPHPVEVAGWRDCGRVLGRFADEVRRRQQPDAPDGPELYLFIHDLPRFRDLRRREDDFGFNRRDEEASPADNLETLLRDGPGYGVHVLTWCDTLNNLNRSFSNQTLREFEMRVLFQMSPNDSAHLLDSPLAAKLGPHRALFSSEDQNRSEKFRPYGLPPDEWLAHLREQFLKRGAAVEG
jgi:S-DNA-T family DNA segregation ATPase FtsK/SpoIIIE